MRCSRGRTQITTGRSTSPSSGRWCASSMATTWKPTHCASGSRRPMRTATAASTSTNSAPGGWRPEATIDWQRLQVLTRAVPVDGVDALHPGALRSHELQLALPDLGARGPDPVALEHDFGMREFLGREPELRSILVAH